MRTGTPAARSTRTGSDLETKNIYVWFKVPDTSLNVTVGLQNQSDDYGGMIYGGADLAGIFMNGQFEPVKYKLGGRSCMKTPSPRHDDMTFTSPTRRSPR